ncbi:hypothetical protein LI221_09935 [Faecalimonas umbilicata]|nr:hypothetical protein [Faecalimonas umbilicata]
MGAVSFKVKQSALKTGSQEFRQYRGTLNSVRTSVEDAGRVMSGMKGSAALVCTSLSKIAGKMERYAECAESMSSALEEIAGLYGNTESTLTGNSEKNKFLNSVVAAKSYAIPSIGLIAPLTAKNLDGGWFGYEFDEDHPGVTAWVGKANAEIRNESAYAEVNAYLGKVTGEVKADGGFMKTKKKSEYKNGEWTEKETVEYVEAEFEAKIAGDILAGDLETGAGDEMLGLEGKLDGAVGSGELSGKGQFSIGEDGVNANLEGKAMVSAVKGKATGTINILGFEITGEASGYAGALGVEGKIGIVDGKFVARGGAAALIGGSAGIEIGFNEEGWDNFVDFITFWD